MNRKTIKAILSKKFNDWVSSITDAGVKKLVEENSIITGGSIVSLLQNEQPNDFDIYFKNKETVLAVAQYYAKVFNDTHNTKSVEVKEDVDENNNPNGRIRIFIKSVGVVAESEFNSANEIDEIFMGNDPKDFIDLASPLGLQDTTGSPGSPGSPVPEEPKKLPYRPVYLSSNAITLSNKVQLIIRFYGDVEQIHKNFDFVHVMSYWTSCDGKLELNPESLECILVKELRYNGSLYPIASMIRTRKFIKKGWNINAGQYLKMAFQLTKLNLEDIKVLEDQLMGVDATYFNILIDQLKKQLEKDPNFKYTDSYVVSIIDKMF